MTLILDTATQPLKAVISVPGSKSIANRALICAALADGTTTLSNLASGDDTAAMIDCLRALHIEIKVDGTTATIIGSDGRPNGGGELNARLAGTTSRFMTALAALSAVPSLITGDAPLCHRPMKPLHDALTQLGAHVKSVDQSGHLPVWVSGDALDGGTVSIPGDISSQYVSALMMIGPYLAEGIRLQLTSPLVSRPYVAITASVMSSFGATGIAIGDHTIGVEPSAYTATSYAIEADASSASYPLAAAAIAGGSVKVLGVGQPALQGDAAFVEVLKTMGCATQATGESLEVKSTGVLHGIEINMADMSDLVPTLAVVAVFADSPTRITGVGFIRQKESDRIGDLVTGLKKIGCDAVEEDDGILIRPVKIDQLHGAELSTHDDHRLAMAWSLLALRVSGISIDEPEVVSKSWPEWWDVRSTLLNVSAN
ncbi:MAG: 3-phosphoshikimate 1-carboxyvinyltransferase [Actinobacteria bacterium]|uniref:3-phosphoshikimate 1-carboxyvinyltransferase n=1 Tax=freshwater metagenome TaxID=449393 RepID=A0A6J6SEL3_9ZZZZ|nr:3-phosphoshikimate 1-carboxyvinyltransferase [Actinomycetota bacterium]MSX15242.1 3-phosphoshikimate 1-carboxyvinyltransferase [Actinomycetota bacterium]MSX35743.1 3-phosphoshikimate 1-carboxyvinyltransferase [Actinomycetota bacterium]MSX78326.1 3-phosphoshikimate 1-carboxyvinyltransferase [Actinomycetota bacterium]MUH57146.1 3-phosphoshikimate 1-carboxyvinyltransferase [Actinomycetota bacterium]